MWTNTRITRLLNIQLPIIQAPMAGGATTPELVAAVSNAGGLGSLGAGYMSADEIRKSIKHIRELTHQPFAVNLFIPEKHHATVEQIERATNAVQATCPELHFKLNNIKPPYAHSFEEQMNAILEEKVPVFSFAFGIPSSYWIEHFKKNGMILIGTATTLEEANLLEKNNIDMIVAQGSEAGGHRGTFLGTAEDALMNLSSLVQLLVPHIHIPIIAAGGIMNANDIVSLLKLNVDAVQMGTAFLCCTESGIASCYKKILLDSHHDTTTLTRAFSGKLARGLNNAFIQRMRPFENDILDYPIQNSLTKSMRSEAAKQNNTDFMSLWAGQAAYLCKEQTATQFIQELSSEVTQLLKI